MSILTALITIVVIVLIAKAVLPKKGKKADPPPVPKDEDAINILKREILLETDPEREAALKKKLEALQAVPPPLPTKKSNKRRNVLIGLGILFGALILSSLTSKKEETRTASK